MDVSLFKFVIVGIRVWIVNQTAREILSAPPLIIIVFGIIREIMTEWLVA